MFQIHFNNGLRYESTGDYVSAEKEYLLADQEYPFSATLMVSILKRTGTIIAG
jgi:hypothetical protein